ncbi:MAG: PHB depolymerase family esterase [Geminicoccaceae bacterium]
MAQRLPAVLALAAALLGASVEAVRAECGGTDRPCAVPLGTYRAAVPPWQAGEPLRPVVIHFHGFGQSGADVLQEQALVEPLMERGYVLLAPDGLVPPGRTERSWSFGTRQVQRDELAFVRQVLTDAVPRFHLDRGRVLASGFSIGGSLTWYLACEAPSEFAAFAPVAGGFWQPMPTECAGPVRLLHTHGWRDQTVPLEGRPLRPGLEQGDIFAGLQVWRRANGCTGLMADRFATDGERWHRAWDRCLPGSALELVLHTGGHEVPAGWADMALDWFEHVTARPDATGDGD